MKYTVILLLLPFFAYSQNPKGVSPIANSQSQGLGTKNTYAVVVGISDYQDAGIPDLRYADKDAEAFANFLRSPAGGSLNSDQLQVLTNSQATAGRIAEALDALIEKAKKDDQVIIYFSGHGDVEGKKLTQPGFLLCWDAPSRVYMGGGTYSLSFLQEVVSTLSLQNQAKVVVITDACHAGKLAGNQIGGAQLTTANLAKQYANEIKILSCQPNEYSLEGPQWGGGRGVFSYHLVDGLFGLADRNNDGQITLGEIDRYLEDHVTAEAAPQSQVPILLGNKTDRLATINASILADLKKNKSGGMAVFASTESRGFEDEILAKADTNVVLTYLNFKKAILEKRFLSPVDNCAEGYYAQLEKLEILAPLRGIMKRNYAAALQDDAQQVLNTMLKSGLTSDILSASKVKEIYKDYPTYLGLAAQLLGKDHYMYNILQARMHFFKGYIQTNTQEAKRQLFQAIQWQADMPQAYVELIGKYPLEKLDSNEYFARKAIDIAPFWVKPYTELSLFYSDNGLVEKAEEMLNQAMNVDSLSLMVWYSKAWFFAKIRNFEKAEYWYKKVIAHTGTDICFPCVYQNLGSVYRDTRRYDLAEQYYKNAILLDSSFSKAQLNLGNIYFNTNRKTEAEQQFKKAIQFDPTWALAFYNLAYLYRKTERYAEAEVQFKKAIQLDSTYSVAYDELGNLYYDIDRYAEAEQQYKNAIKFDSAYAFPYIGLGDIYCNYGRYFEAEAQFKKALQLDANQAICYYSLAMVYSLQGQLKEAFAYLEKYLKYETDTYDSINNDPDLKKMQDQKDQWMMLMKKHFPDQFKE